MTVLEHLYIYANMKGIEDVMQDILIKSVLEEMGLEMYKNY